MAKSKLTSNQQEYLKQVKRIRRSLAKLRKQGFDVSDLSEQYTTQLPKRVTKKALEELQSITPKKLRKDLTFIGAKPLPQKHYPLSTKPSEYAYKPHPTLTPSEEALFIKPPVVAPRDYGIPIPLPPTPETEVIDLTNIIDTEAITQEQPNIIAQETEDEILYIDTDTGEIVDRRPIERESEPPVTVEETEDEILYIDTETGEILRTITKVKGVEDVPDLSSMAIEYLRDIANQFSPKISLPLNKYIDDMIKQFGEQKVADAFTEAINDRPSLLQMLGSVNTKYYAIKILAGELSERLNFDIDTREMFRDEVTRESMSDMEDYI